MAINIVAVVDIVRQILGYRVSVAALVGIAFLVGFPYLLVGVLWSISHAEHLSQLHGVDLVVSFLASIVSWPVLLFTDVCVV
jgi:hypothetical protein